MTKNPIRWHVVPRDAVTEYLLRGAPPHQAGRSAVYASDLFSDSVALGMSEASNQKHRPVLLVMLKKASAVETFSWLRTYSPAVSPLSQFVRVLTDEDWQSFGQPHESVSRQGGREDVWASIVLGEVIAQGDSDVELSQVPLSRAGSSFSYAVARTSCIHGAGEATKTCAERLRLVENDRRFARRHVPVADLFPIWSLATANVPGGMRPDEAATSLLHAVTNFIPGSDLAVRSVSEQIRARRGLGSDSVEERVLAFQQISGELLRAGVGPASGIEAAVLAVSAFLVGRSTSHEFLIRRVGRAFPTSPVWFGLIAALCGPSGWDEHWTRAAKGIERQLRAPFDIGDVSGWDLCWSEFSWFSVAFSGDVFSTLSKLIPRALSIEILPGATCQFRLAGIAAGEGDARPTPEVSERERELVAIVAQVVSLATKARKVLEPEVSRPAQQSLLEERPKLYKPKKRRYGDE